MEPTERQADAFTIERILRPILSANRVLRDYFASKFTVTGNGSDDPPDADTIGRAIDAVKAAQAMPAIGATVAPLIELMAPAASTATIDALVAAVVDRDQLSMTLDGPIATPAVAMVANKYRHASELPSPEMFLRQCIREQHAMHETLARLEHALVSMSQRVGWYR